MAGYGKLAPYTPPSWAMDLKIKPKSRIKLSMTPTPIHRWNLPGVPPGFQISVKREDLTGSTLTGNKVRKLEFLLADALDQGCDSVITIGPFLSNHCRATVMAAREAGLEPHVVVMALKQPEKEMPPGGNLLLNRLAGVNMVFLPFNKDNTIEEAIEEAEEKMLEYAKKLSNEGHKAYIIPPGGASTLGTWGYIDGFAEMMEQGLLENFDDIVLATGTSGSLCGLIVAKYLTNAPIKLHAVAAVHKEEKHIYDHVNHELQALGLCDVRAEDLVDPITNYVSLGPGQSTVEELETIIDVVSHTGVSLDPVFCVKGVRGMLTEMKINPERFAGKRVLFIHSGGIYGLFDGRIDDVVKENPITNRITMAQDIFNE